MLGGPFVRRALVTRETSAAQTDVRKASEGLKRIVRQAELGDETDGAVRRETTDAIDYAVHRLQLLKQRIERHADRVVMIAELEACLNRQESGFEARETEIDSNIVRVSVERVQILSERDRILRDIVIARRIIQVG